MDSGWSWSPSRPLANISNNRLNALNGSGLKLDFNRGPQALQPGKENTVPANKDNKSTNKSSTATTASKKRKSDAVEELKQNLFPDDAPEIDDDDPRLRMADETCNAIRRKIRTWIESGAQKVGEFQNTIQVSPRSYQSFMNRTKTWDGEYNDTYIKALAFFKKRELQGLPLKANGKTAKKSKSASPDEVNRLLDVSMISLPGEDAGKVPVYDTCDEIRKKIRAFLKHDGLTQAAFVREISKSFPDERKVSPRNLQSFLGLKGPLSGNTNKTFYAAYVFFEKLRIKQGKPKSNFREKMEEVHGWRGVNVEYSSSRPIFCRADARPCQDEYGRIVCL